MGDTINWFKRHDDTIDLVRTMKYSVGYGESSPEFKKAKDILETIESMQPIRSRQVAALAIVTSLNLAALSLRNTEKKPNGMG